jgi:hypothetical protein
MSTAPSASDASKVRAVAEQPLGPIAYRSAAERREVSLKKIASPTGVLT